MGGSPVAIGPFQGGLNRLEDPRIIEDNELAECINFDIGRGGELTTRVGLKGVRSSTNPVAGTNDLIRIINPVTLPTGFSRLYVRVHGILSNRIYYSDTPDSKTAAWTKVVSENANQVGVIVQFVDDIQTTVPYAYFVPRGPGSTGIRQNLTDNTEETTGDIVGMPRGSGAVVFKGRMFIYGPMTEGGTGTYRVYYSAAGNFESWPVNNFFDVGAGDGEFVTAMTTQGDTLIIFKRNSTWALFFDSDPFQGSLRKVNNEIGATGPNAVTSYQNDTYIISKRSIHRMINLQFDDIGKNLMLQQARTQINFETYFDDIAVIGNRILCTVATGGGVVPFFYFCYHTDTNAWSEYDFDEYPDRFVRVEDANAFDHQYATARNSVNLYDLKPHLTTNANYGDFPDDRVFVSLATKKFDYGTPAAFKRMFWWAVETVGNNKSFDMYIIADDARQSATATRTTGFTRSVAKAFVTNRFRNVQYVVRASTAGLRMTLFAGQANVQDKAKVSQSVTS